MSMFTRLLSRTQAAVYLGVSQSLFDKVVRDQLPSLVVGTSATRYDINDLDAWVDAQTKYPARCPQPHPKVSSSEGLSGTSTRPSESGRVKSSFAERLAQARSQQQS
jgi:predicted DNA-binding transcriptional regulator AlpA